MKKLRFFGLLVTIALLAFGLTVGCSNGSTDEEPEAQSSVFTGKTASGQDVEITFSNVAIAKARAAGPYQNGFYLLKIDGVEKSRGRTRLDSNKDITFIPDGGGTEFHGELLNGVLEVSGTVDGVALNVRTTTEDSGTTPGGVGGGGGSGTGGGARDAGPEKPVITLDATYEKTIGVDLPITAGVSPKPEGVVDQTYAWYLGTGGDNYNANDNPLETAKTITVGNEVDDIDDDVFLVFVATNIDANGKKGIAKKGIQITFVAAPDHEPVTNIELTSGSYIKLLETGPKTYTLLATVLPEDATNKTIVWSLKVANIPAGVTIEGNDITVPDDTATGAFQITATIANGLTETTAYTKDFTLTIIAATDLLPPTITVTTNTLEDGKYIKDHTTVTFSQDNGAEYDIYYVFNSSSSFSFSDPTDGTIYPGTAVEIDDDDIEYIHAAVFKSDDATAYSLTEHRQITQAQVAEPVITLTDKAATAESATVGGGYITSTTPANASKFEITTTTAGASIRYNLTATAPTDDTDLQGTKYENPVPFDGTTVGSGTTQIITAVAFKTGYKPSDTATETFTQAKVMAPDISLGATGVDDSKESLTTVAGYYKTAVGGGTASTFTIASGGTPGADIYYLKAATGTGTPDDTSTAFVPGTTAAVTITETPTLLVKAIAIKDGWADSAVAEGNFAHAQVGDVSATPATDTGMTFASATITLECVDTPDADIEYTIADTGGTPTAINASGDGTAYASPIPLTGKTGAVAIKAKAFKAGYLDSDELDAGPYSE